MIKNIFLPEKIGNYFIFPKRVIGFFLDKNMVSATQLYFSGQRKTIVEKYIQEPLDIINNLSLNDKLSQVIEKIIRSLDKYDSIKVSLPGNLVIFKELKLPFTDIDKIKMVLDFEVESALPFSIDEAVTDFVVIKKDIKKKESTILACIARKKDVKELIDIFKNAGLQLSTVGVDVIDIYNLYKSIHPNATENVIILDIEFSYTNVIYIHNGHIKLVRTIQQSTENIIKAISQDLKIDQITAQEYLNRFGLESSEDKEYNKAINSAMNDFISALQFTLNSFKNIYPDSFEINKLVITGNNINNLDNLLKNKLNIDCQNLNMTNVLQNNNIKVKEPYIQNISIRSFATAYENVENENFNLLKKELEIANVSLLNKQILTSLLLFFLIFIPLIGFSYYQTSKLQKEVDNSKKEVIAKLKNEFEISDPVILKNLNQVIQAAHSKLNEEETIWFAFSQNTRLSFLKYLNELGKIIDKSAIGLNLKKLSIFTTAPDVITLQGEVKDFKSLGILENQLNESNLFSHVSVPQETKFNIDITIKKNEELE